METKQADRPYVLFVAVSILVAGMLLAGCAGQPAPATPTVTEVSIGTPTPTAPEVAEVQTDFQVRRELPVVWAGPGDIGELPQLDHDDWQDLLAGGLVTTDDDGEGWVKISDCMLIYIFQNSRLVKAACPKSDYTGGNVTCAIEGTSVFNNACASQTIQTPSAEIRLEGTWLSVTYLPEERLTVVMVFEGVAEVWPVRNFDVRILDDPVDVVEGHFWFSTPGVRADPVAGLAAREPHPFHQLLPLVEELDLWPWIDRMRVRADADNVPFPEYSPTAPAPTSTLRPTPRPVALCTVVADTLNLRSGPGTIYTPPITMLPNGTRLEPQARSPDGEWIQVWALGISLEGWVAASASYVSCNMPLTDLPVRAPPPTPTMPLTATPTRTPVVTITPTPTAKPTKQYVAPELLEPLNQSAISDPPVTLKWRWDGALDPDEYFDVRVWFGGQPAYGIGWTKETTFTVRPEHSIWHFGHGWYHWQIVLIQGKNGQWIQDLSPPSQEWVFQWIEAPQKGGIRGLVVDQYQYPRTDFPVWITRDSLSGPVVWQGDTNNDGRFDTSLILDPNRYWVQADCYYGEGQRQGQVEVSVTAGQYADVSMECFY